MLQKLLETAFETRGYGPIQAWEAKSVKNVALLVKAFNRGEMKRLPPQAIAGLSSQTMEVLSTDLMKEITLEQQQYLTDRALATYRNIMGIKSVGCRTILAGIYKYAVIVHVVLRLSRDRGDT